MDYISIFSLKNKIAWVTGGATGIGFGISRALAEAGAKVVFNCRNEKKLQEALQQFSTLGIDAAGYICDVTDESES